MKKPEVGQMMYAVNIGNNARYQEQKARRVQVISVGRKYVKAIPPELSAHPHMAVEYHIDTGFEKTEYSVRWKLYESEQAWADEKEAKEISEKIGKLFSRFGKPPVSLEALRAVKAALNGYL